MTIKLSKGINQETKNKTIVFGKLEGFDNNYFNFNFGFVRYRSSNFTSNNTNVWVYCSAFIQIFKFKN